MTELLLAAERMLAVGLLDQAERLFRQVADADPRNAIAVVGLARVALERGDETGALALAREALAIDPENVAARRMLDRLEEVIATRAATVTAPEPEAPHPTPPEPAEPSGPRPRRRSWLGRLLARLLGR